MTRSRDALPFEYLSLFPQRFPVQKATQSFVARLKRETRDFHLKESNQRPITVAPVHGGLGHFGTNRIVKIEYLYHCCYERYLFKIHVVCYFVQLKLDKKRMYFSPYKTRHYDTLSLERLEIEDDALLSTRNTTPCVISFINPSFSAYFSINC